MKVNEIVLGESIVAKVKNWLEDRRNQKVQKVWDNKTDDEIMIAYDDASSWLQLHQPEKGPNRALPDSLVTSLRMRMDKFIMPQMEKRDLHNY